MQATPGDSGWTLDGVKSYVLDGATANLILVAARSDAGVSLFAVQPDAEGLTRTALSTMDYRKQAKLEFSGVPATLIGTDGGGWDPLDRPRSRRCGARRRAGRWRSDVPRHVGRVRQGPCAVRCDRLVPGHQAQVCRHAPRGRVGQVRRLLRRLVRERNERRASPGCLACQELLLGGLLPPAENIQIHGGIGFTWEHPAHLAQAGEEPELLFGDPTYTGSYSPSESAFEPGTVLTTPRSYASAHGLGVLRFRCSALTGDALSRWPGDGGDGGPTASGGVRFAGRRRLDRRPTARRGPPDLLRRGHPDPHHHLDWFTSVGVSSEHGEELGGERRSSRGSVAVEDAAVDAVVAKSVAESRSMPSMSSVFSTCKWRTSARSAP